jgi:protein TonB
MRTRNLMVSAVCTIVLIVGVAWLGNGRPPVSAAAPDAARPRIVPQFVLPPDEAPSVSQASDPPKPAPPSLADVPRDRPPDAFPQAVEPPVPELNVDNTMVSVPADFKRRDGPWAFTPDELDEQPVASFQASPDYPAAMRQAGATGQVLVDFIVDAKGAVRNVQAVRSSRPEFEEPACRAVAKWRFKPGRRGGLLVATHMQVPIVFSLEGAP